MLRTSAASLVCPLTPFLAPRLLFTQASLTIVQAHRTLHARNLHATSPTKIKRKKNNRHLVFSRRKETEENVQAITEKHSLLKRFQQACETRNVQTIMDLYPTVRASDLLDHNDTRRIAQALHVYARNTRNSQSRIDIHEFVEQLGRDLSQGALPPNPHAHVHLMGLYKEWGRYAEGRAFWNWLSNLDDTYVNAGVYGAAIELMAYQGKDDLRSLEDLYTDALKRFPGTFAEYHLSPDAIIPDRSQPTVIPGIPIHLLQGILTARILSRDWRNAYFALDTALRLYPTSVPQRFFDLFLRERPITEGYTVFLIACRSGVLPKPALLTTLITTLRSAMNKTSTDQLHTRVTLLRGMANAMYAYSEVGGAIQAPHIGAFLEAFGDLLRQETFDGEDKEVNAEYKKEIATAAHDIATGLIHSGMAPHPQIFIALINIAARYSLPDLFMTTLQHLESAQVDIGRIGLRCTIRAAGKFGDKKLTEQLWERMAVSLEAEGEQISPEDWINFAKVSQSLGNKDYFEQQLQRFGHSINNETQASVLRHLNEGEIIRPNNNRSNSKSQPFSLEKLKDELEVIREYTTNISAVIMSGSPLDMRKSPFYMFLDPNRKPLGSIEDLRMVYDEFTTDPHQPLPQESKQADKHLSQTGIPLDELRFHNWVTITELMRDAEATEEVFTRSVKEAMRQGRPFNARNFRLRVPMSQEFAQGDPALKSPSESIHIPRGGLRDRIRQLRMVQRPSPPGIEFID